MFLLVRVLMLVACVPLLLPTGFCSCKVDWLSLDLHCQEYIQKDEHQSLSGLKSSCCCGHGDPTEEAQLSPVDKPADPIHTPLNDQQKPECPGCPGAFQTRIIESTVSVSHIFAAFEHYGSFTHELSIPVPPRPLLNLFHTSSLPPIYLTHCALVI